MSSVYWGKRNEGREGRLTCLFGAKVNKGRSNRKINKGIHVERLVSHT